MNVKEWLTKKNFPTIMFYCGFGLFFAIIFNLHLFWYIIPIYLVIFVGLLIVHRREARMAFRAMVKPAAWLDEMDPKIGQGGSKCAGDSCSDKNSRQGLRAEAEDRK